MGVAVRELKVNFPSTAFQEELMVGWFPVKIN